MGIHDRDYYRGEPQPRGHHVGGEMSLVTKLIIVNIAVFIVNIFTPPVIVVVPKQGQYYYVRLSEVRDPAIRQRYLSNSLKQENIHWLQDTMSANADTIVKPWLWWKLLTCGFAHAGVNHILFNMLGLFFLGGAVERKYGAKEFLAVYLASIVIGSAVWSARNHFLMETSANFSLLGASGAVTAIIMLFIFNFPNRTLLLMMVIPMPAWLVGVIIIVANMIGIGGEHIAYDVHLTGVAFAACYFFLGWNLSRFLPSSGGPRRRARGFSLFRPRPRLKVHEPEADYGQLDAEADRVLDKLHSQGEASLNAHERKVLEDYSRRMRQKHR